MGSNTATIMTLANSIIGVGVLAMPFCFKQCGIVLSILMLFLSSFLSRLACHFLLKSAIMARRRNFEFLAFHTFGPSGKTIVELCIIGFLMGTCIAFFVVVGDLGPVIVAKAFNVESPATLRPTVLFGLAAFVVLPLGLLRNVDSLSSICTASIGFYLCLVFKVLAEASPHLAAGDWLDKVYLWRPAGLLQCIPIFSMALFCQTQLFEIYDSLPNATLDGMNNLIRAAVNMCTFFYICVGFFGYVAFCTQSFSGNILMSFTPTLASDIIKMGFVLSVAVSFPLVIFPCRASLYSLLFKRVHMTHHETLSSHIPETRFKCLTIGIISVALTVGLLIPNIELVLGLVGSTIGVLICVMFPAIAFIRISTKGSSERLLAQTLVFIGMLILVLGTYATLYAANEASEEVRLGLVSIAPVPQQPSVSPADNLVEKLSDTKKGNKKLEDEVPEGKPKEVLAPDKSVNLIPQLNVEADIKPDVRKEPPVPVEPVADVPTPSPPSELAKEKKPAEEKQVLSDKLVAQESQNVAVNAIKEIKMNAPEVEKKEVIADKALEPEVNQDAIKKEDIEIEEAEKQVEAEDDKKKQELLRKLEQHQEEQKKLLQEQKQILKELKEHEKDIEAKKTLPEIAEKPKIKAEAQHDESIPLLKDLAPKIPKEEKPIQSVQEGLKIQPAAIEKLGEKPAPSLQKEPLLSQVFKTEDLKKLNSPIAFKDKMLRPQADGSLVQNSNLAGIALQDQETKLSSFGKVKLPEKINEVVEEPGIKNKPQGESIGAPKILAPKQILPLPFALRNKQEMLNNSPDAHPKESPVQQQPEPPVQPKPEEDSKLMRRDILAETVNQSVNIRDILSSRGGKMKLPEHLREKRDTLIEASEDIATEREPSSNKETLKQQLNENEVGNCDVGKKPEGNARNDNVKSLIISETVNHLSTNVENNKQTPQEQNILIDAQVLPDKVRKSDSDLVVNKDFKKLEEQVYSNEINNEASTLSSLIRTPSLLSEPKMEDSQLQALKDTLKDAQAKDGDLLAKPLKRDLKSVQLSTQDDKQKTDEKLNEPAH